MLSRRGLHRLRYHALHVRRAHLLTMRATPELSDQHATLELIGGLLMSSDEEPLPGCFQRAHSASWLKNKSAASEKYQTACGVLSGKYPSYPQGGADPNGNGRADARQRANRPRRVYSVEQELEGSDLTLKEAKG